jgi:parvulin-like peptidyl-prolyl isomerase
MKILLAVLLAGGCQKADKGSPPAPGSGSAVRVEMGSGSGGMMAGSGAKAAPDKDIDSKDILARTDVAAETQVKHVLLGWGELLPVYGRQMDPRAAKRSNADAATLAQDLLAKLKANPDQIDALIKEHSEDPGSLSGNPYVVATGSRFVPEFKTLALRLKEKEAGIVRTKYGYHVMERVVPPPPDPLESADITSRPAVEAADGPIEVHHILIGWKDLVAAGDARAKTRTKADADKLAKELLDKVRAGGDMAKLMKEHSEDPGTKDNARTYEITPDIGLPETFKKLALRLKVGEAGLVKTEVGWHVIKRVPPDSLNSVDILKRAQVTDKAKVKHILLGWKGGHADDKRGAERERPALEKLVKDTVAKLKKGAKIEPLMKELSEDPGSAASGESYDVTPAAGLVPPFKNLSLRLNKNEVGIVKTQFGIHIIQRVE